MKRVAAVVLMSGAAAVLVGCSTPKASPSVGVNPAPLSHTAQDDRACAALDVLYANHHPATAAEASAMSGDGLAADNTDIVHETAQLLADSRAGDQAAAKADLEALSRTCKKMGIGPTVG